MRTQEWLVSSDTSSMATNTCIVPIDKSGAAKSSSALKQTNKKLIKLIINNEDRAPYRKFCKYKIEIQSTNE